MEEGVSATGPEPEGVAGPRSGAVGPKGAKAGKWGVDSGGGERERGKRPARREGKKGGRAGPNRGMRGAGARGPGGHARPGGARGQGEGPGRGSHFLAPLALAVQLPLQALRAVLRLVRLLLQRLDLAFHRLQGVEAGHGAEARGRTQRALGSAGLGSGESCSSRAPAPEPLPAPGPPPPLPAPGPAAVGAMRSPGPAADVSTAGGGPDVGTAGRSCWKVPLFGTYLEKAPGGTASFSSFSSSSLPPRGFCRTPPRAPAFQRTYV